MTVSAQSVQAADILARAAADGRAVLLEPEVYALLAGVGIGVPAHRLVASPDDVGDDTGLAADEVVVKVVSPDVLHKSDVGGVLACPNRAGAVREAVARVLGHAREALPSARLRGALVAERVRFEPGLGREVLVSFRHDPAFGPVLALGVGGLDAECLLGMMRPEYARTLWSAARVASEEGLRRLRRTWVHRALVGALRSRRTDAIPEERLAQVLTAFAGLALSLASFDPPGGIGLLELEVNPLVADPAGRLVALDGLARSHRPRPPAPPRPVRLLSRLLTPKSALVIGASAETDNPGRVILRNLVAGGGLPAGRVSAIHPRAEAIEGCRAFRSVEDLPDPVDLAVVSVARDLAEGFVEKLVRTRRARTITLIAGGFGETEGGRAAEARLRALLAESHRADDGGVVLNGGNCLGIVSEPGGYSTFFIPPRKLRFRRSPSSCVAAISQSGAHLVSQMSNLDGCVAFRYAISLGNQMDLTVSDYLEFLEGDEAVRVFTVYLEGFQPGDGARFLDVVRRLTAAGRAVLLYKAGRTVEGGAAAASHSAAAVGDHEVCAELAAEAGAVVCATLDGFEDALVTFSLLTHRPALGRRVAVLSNAGYECTAAADSLGGLELADLRASTRERLRALLPAGVVDVHNPVDATPVTPTERYAACADALLADPGVDALVVAGVPATPALDTLPHEGEAARPTGLSARLVQVFRSTPKPTVFSVDAGPLYDPLVSSMREAGLPCFRRVDRAIHALAMLVESQTRPFKEARTWR